MSDRSIVTIVIVILALIGGFVVCDAAFDDEDEPGDLGAPAWVLRDRGCDDQSCTDHRDCYQARAECSDDDQLAVVVCVEPESCRFG